MITLGFKNKFGGWLRAISAIILGIIMVSNPGTSLVVVVKILAAFLIASGIVTIVYGIINRQRGSLPLQTTNAVVDIVVGIILFMYPTLVASILIILIGIALLGLGVWQLIVLGSAASVIRAGFWIYIFPVLCVCGGLLLLFNPFGSAATLTMIAGIAVLVYGISEIIATWKMNRAMKASDIRNAPENEFRDDMADAQEADYQKVDEQ